MTCINKLSPKAPEAKVTLTFDFTNGLNPGEILTTFVSRNVSCIAGVDVDPTLMWNGTQVLNVPGTMVNQDVQAGNDACFYQFTVVYDTSMGRRLVVSAVLPVSSSF